MIEEKLIEWQDGKERGRESITEGNECTKGIDRQSVESTSSSKWSVRSSKSDLVSEGLSDKELNSLKRMLKNKEKDEKKDNIIIRGAGEDREGS